MTRLELCQFSVQVILRTRRAGGHLWLPGNYDDPAAGIHLDAHHVHACRNYTLHHSGDITLLERAGAARHKFYINDFVSETNGLG
jgi:hypothetical protein